ncbi:hypothetical protein DY000_02036284 [Brassica cretica]|uniref:Uncharacterized protein n=1 Tax=Brassica cretica TaxID=69181 RepID=A0ABQ7B627_BRACR|nr:hypothetical protein DY000_02036284 [Brassica cretica]
MVRESGTKDLRRFLSSDSRNRGNEAEKEVIERKIREITIPEIEDGVDQSRRTKEETRLLLFYLYGLQETITCNVIGDE